MTAGAPPTTLFVGGLGRSGSTVIELLLARHPDVCALGEVVHLWTRGLRDDERCGCGTPFSGCGFWREVGERAFGGWSGVDPDAVRTLAAAVDRTRHIPRLARGRLPDRAAAALHRYSDYYTRLYRAAAEASGASVVIDTSKHASLAFALHTAGVDVRVLHLVRDSRAVAHSWAKQVRRPEVTGAPAYMPRFSPLTVSTLWTVQNAAFELLARSAPVTRLRYEDFTTDPDGALARLRELAGLPAHPPPASADTATVPAAHTVAGNPLRFTTGEVQVRRDDAWRTAPGRGRRAVVGALTLPLRLRYGYRGRPAAPERPA